MKTSGLERMIPPFESRHLRGFAITRFVGGGILLAAGNVCLAADADGRAAFFLGVGALSVAAGAWDLALARRNAA